MNKELFVVQRCWHSSPRQVQPMDYLRLFEQQQDAEKAAFHSAAAWSRHHTGEESVRTLLLPSYPAHSRSGSSYAFIAHGSLFWVRSLIASSNTPLPPHLLTLTPSHAHVVVTEGVIGGTGNRNSRRGTEVPSGRVFFGTTDAAQFMARQSCHQVVAHLPQGCHSEVVTVPIGKPSDYTSQRFLLDWPPQVMMPSTTSPTMPAFIGASSSSSSSQNPTNKRESAHCIGSHEGTEVECPFSVQPMKRRRFCREESTLWLPNAATVSEDEMLMG
jgi:hypothetical protein